MSHPPSNLLQADLNYADVHAQEGGILDASNSAHAGDTGIHNGTTAITTGGVVATGRSITTVGERGVSVAEPPDATLAVRDHDEGEISLYASSYYLRSNNQFVI